jgi:O-antigen/teichoic acid export membrane protein
VLARLAGGPRAREYGRLLTRSALPLGLAGVIIVIYDAMYPVVLSKLLNLESVAIFTVALRLVFPVVIITQAIANVFFTLLVRAWEEGIAAFEYRQRQFTLLVAVIACGLFTGMYVGAEFFVGLFGEEVEESAAVLRVVVWALMGRALTTAMAPPIVISGHQGKTLGLMLFTVILSTLIVLALVPVYGIWGAAYAFVIVEVALTGIPTAVLSQYWAGFRMHWWRLAAVMALAVLVTQGARAFDSFGSLGLAVAAGLVFTALLFVTRTLSVRDIVELSAARGARAG